MPEVQDGSTVIILSLADPEPPAACGAGCCGVPANAGIPGSATTSNVAPGLGGDPDHVAPDAAGSPHEHGDGCGDACSTGACATTGRAPARPRVPVLACRDALVAGGATVEMITAASDREIDAVIARLDGPPRADGLTWPTTDGPALVVAVASDGQLRAVIRRMVRRYAPPPSRRPADLPTTRTIPDLPRIAILPLDTRVDTARINDRSDVRGGADRASRDAAGSAVGSGEADLHRGASGPSELAGPEEVDVRGGPGGASRDAVASAVRPGGPAEGGVRRARTDDGRGGVAGGADRGTADFRPSADLDLPDLADRLGLPRDPADVAKAVLGGRSRRVDLFRNDGGSITVHGALLGGVDGAGTAQPWLARVELDDHVLADGREPVLAVAVANGNGYAHLDELPLAPAADPSSGVLTVAVAVPVETRSRLGRRSVRIEIRRASGRAVSVTPAAEVPFADDGVPGVLTRKRAWWVEPGAWSVATL